MSLDTISLQCFLAVAETNSFTQAAKLVCRTQSAVSQQIAKLESSFNTCLFNRKQQLTLTNDGEVFFGYARQIYQLQREAIDFFKEPELSGEIRLGLPEDFATVYLKDVLTNFSRLHPRVTLNVDCDLTLNLLNKYKSGAFDLVILKKTCPKNIKFSTEICQETLEWVGDKELINRSNELPLVLSPQPCVYRASTLKALQNCRQKWRIVYTSPSFNGVIAAVQAGLGITVLPRLMIREPLIIIRSSKLPRLATTSISLIKKEDNNPLIETLAECILNKFVGSP